MPQTCRLVNGSYRLGSPGDASLSASQYYGHPQNQFWKLVGGAIQQDLVAMDYATRISALHSAGIALWDVIGAAHREGSLDHNIRNAEINDLRQFVTALPQLRVIAFNGKKAASLAKNAFEGLAIEILHNHLAAPPTH